MTAAPRPVQKALLYAGWVARPVKNHVALRQAILLDRGMKALPHPFSNALNRFASACSSFQAMVPLRSTSGRNSQKVSP